MFSPTGYQPSTPVLFLVAHAPRSGEQRQCDTTTRLRTKLDASCDSNGGTHELEQSLDSSVDSNSLYTSPNHIRWSVRAHANTMQVFVHQGPEPLLCASVTVFVASAMANLPRRVHRMEFHDTLHAVEAIAPIAAVKRTIATMAATVGLTTGREPWIVVFVNSECGGGSATAGPAALRQLSNTAEEIIPFGIHRGGGIVLLDNHSRMPEEHDGHTVVSLGLRGRRKTNRNKKAGAPSSPDEIYYFEAKTKFKEHRTPPTQRSDAAARVPGANKRQGAVVEDFADPYVAVLRELYHECRQGYVSLYECAVPYVGGALGQPNGRVECYDRPQPRRVYQPMLCFTLDDGREAGEGALAPAAALLS